MYKSVFLKSSHILVLVFGFLFCANGEYSAPKPKERIVQKSCSYVYGYTNKLYKDFVSQDKPMAYVFTVDRKYIQSSHVSERRSQQTTNLRIEVGTANNVSVQYPIMFAVRQQKSISTLEVPSESESGQGSKATSYQKQNGIHYNAARTLCIVSNEGGFGRDGINVTVRVTTQSVSFLQFYIRLNLTKDFELQVGKKMTFDVSPTTPKYYHFSFARPDMSQVKIRATSPSMNCMTISVQRPQCPVYDLERNVRYQGLWQTMSTRAAMTVQKLNWYSEGFMLVFVAHADKEFCMRKNSLSAGATANSSGVNPYRGFNYLFGPNLPDEHSKTIELLITDESRISSWIFFLCLLIPIIATLLTSLAVLCLFRNRHEWMVEILSDKFDNTSKSRELITNSNNDSSQPAERNSRFTYPSADNADADQTMAAEMLLNEMMADSASTINSLRRARRPHSSNEQQNPRVHENQESVGCCRWKSNVFIADFNCKQYHEVKKFSKRFYWTILIVAIFYSIPVYQLVLHYLRVLYRTGEYDICYYNYLCAQRLGLLIDFNHFWSNASYVIFGGLYILTVRQRSRNLCLPTHKHGIQLQNGKSETDKGGGCFCCCSSRNNSPGKAVQICCCTFTRICFRWDHGVAAHFGVFYALGVALTMEGLLSAAYHLCPNQSTFQFDTCFMYVIAVLLLLKIYQFRHPVHFGANQTFAILAGFVFISVLGLLFEQGTDKDILIFKCVFLPIQYVIMIILCIYYYAVGYVKDGQLKSHGVNGDRLILPFISFSICIAVLVYTELAKIGFASYLLYLLVGNVLGTTLYYVGIMKPLHGEFKNRTWVQPVLYFLASAVIGGFSLQYFVRAPAQWELSASASRAENEDCLNGWFPFHPFYDSHDAWHFLSAAALFLAFMGLLIVDDDLITTPQNQIPVF